MAQQISLAERAEHRSIDLRIAWNQVVSDAAIPAYVADVCRLTHMTNLLQQAGQACTRLGPDARRTGDLLRELSTLENPCPETGDQIPETAPPGSRHRSRGTTSRHHRLGTRPGRARIVPDERNQQQRPGQMSPRPLSCPT